MKILDAAHVKGSFFVVGKTLDSSPQVVRDLVADGQLVGNHSYHHDEWRWLDPRYPELERTQQAFAREIGTCPVWFRPPHGQRTPLMARVVKDHRMRMAMWDVSVERPRHQRSAAPSRTRCSTSVRGGSIIDLHAGLDGTLGRAPRRGRRGAAADSRRPAAHATCGRYGSTRSSAGPRTSPARQLAR